MNALNLYSTIEQDLDFNDEIQELYATYIAIINEIAVKNLLDIGCGQGDFLLEAQEQNIEVFGIDLSDEQIKVCKSKDLNAQCIDIKDVNKKYDCATAVFDVLNYLDANNIESFIKDTYSCLNKDGYFVFDVNSLHGFSVVAQGSLNINKKDKFISIDAYFENKELKTNITLFSKTKEDLYKKEEDFITQYYHKKSTLKQILIKTGFDVESIIDFNLHDDEKSDKQIFICKKI